MMELFARCGVGFWVTGVAVAFLSFSVYYHEYRGTILFCLLRKRGESGISGWVVVVVFAYGDCYFCLCWRIGLWRTLVREKYMVLFFLSEGGVVWLMSLMCMRVYQWRMGSGVHSVLHLDGNFESGVRCTVPIEGGLE
ncbi:hypothetical protein BP00DRAFT_274204 [Aspergillus indologenus CBS 114.80]|uniref:Transmembrane protein n=1 Tax=Aspergillus indologenus CBS 114.80 TaxID=1450541 RepID=A0A2V5HUB9_9EURO|nr:hypothetical protein BP00DRAFT_274204 [Aspergillus indologenus CBS 114.80]